MLDFKPRPVTIAPPIRAAFAPFLDARVSRPRLMVPTMRNCVCGRWPVVEDNELWGQICCGSKFFVGASLLATVGSKLPPTGFATLLPQKTMAPCGAIVRLSGRPWGRRAYSALRTPALASRPVPGLTCLAVAFYRACHGASKPSAAAISMSAPVLGVAHEYPNRHYSKFSFSSRTWGSSNAQLRVSPNSKWAWTTPETISTN